jgi:uncharacterized membrane protein
MTDEQKTPAADDDVIVVGEAVVADERGVQAAAAIAIEGDAALIVAGFANEEAAKAAYDILREAEKEKAVQIDGVLVVSSDHAGKIHIHKMTDHTTRTGFAWGAVAGVVLGAIFPPSILASAAVLGAAGAAVGKVGNEMKRREVADALSAAVPPGSSGIVALTTLKDIPEVKATIPDATEVKSVTVSGEEADAIKEVAKKAEGTEVAAATTTGG